MKEKNKTQIINTCCDVTFPQRPAAAEIAVKWVSDVTNGGLIVN